MTIFDIIALFIPITGLAVFLWGIFWLKPNKQADVGQDTGGYG